MLETAPLESCAPLARTSLSDEQASGLERLFKALADRHRVRILNLLARSEEPICVCQLEPALGLAQPTVSYHLKLLVDAGLIEREVRGRFSHDRLAPGALARVGELVGGRPVEAGVA